MGSSQPPASRRRSPSWAGVGPARAEESPAAHPFLDAAGAEPQAGDASRSLLGEWVPGVSGRGAPESGGYSDASVPSALAKLPPHGLEPGAAGGRRGLRRSVWLGAPVCLVALLGLVWLGASWSGGGARAGAGLQALGEGESREDFVRVDGTQFMLDCRPFYVAGFNAHDLVPKSLAVPAEHKTFEDRTGKELVRELLRNATAAGLNVMRIYAHTTDNEHPFMVRPGELNPESLEAMDFVLDAAREAGLKVMVSFADNWKWRGGVDEMLEFSKTVSKRTQQRPPEQNGDFDDQELPAKVKEYEVARHSLFFNDTGARQIYKDFVRSIVTRTNSVNGRAYAADPTIMSWGLLNEPRCESWKVPECTRTFRAWVAEMAAFLKSLDSAHLVTIGAEGFFGADSPQAKHNPQEWGSIIGQDFAADHASPHIDYLTTHMWPDNWARTDRAYQQEWLDAHMQVAANSLRKPLLLEEFGKKLVAAGSDTHLFEQAVAQLRDPVFETTYQMVQAALEGGRPLRGSLFWRWDLVVYRDQPRADYGVRPYDSTFALVRAHAAAVSRLTASQPPAAQCGLQCWVPASSGRNCVQKPKECASQLRAKRSAAPATYPTRTACCRPGLGAFPDGCRSS